DIREIDEFESKNGVRMPSDFREYFLRTNGLGRDGLDPEMFAFWTLDMLERRENTQVFIFADFMTQCWCYAVDLGGEREPKFSVYRDMPDGWVRVGSFAEFVDLYVAGDFDMWTPAGWPHSYDCVNL
ncbi:MAG TPA: SMI1/KNR4 family protein, partial [Candidatus Baltobacteraceae bacterium]|nr:SMI1/KNR4 family protein [Candidatus Baltobacteraceae bacterium]